jgi:hypothetical protein
MMKIPLYLLPIISLLFSSMLAVVADSRTERTNRIKAAFILNIARFTQWPKKTIPDTEGNYQLCFLNKNPLGSAIKTINNKRIGKRRLQINSISSLEHNSGCHILFLTQRQITEISADMEHQSRQENQQRYHLLFDENVLTMGDLSEQMNPTKKNTGTLINLIRHKSTRIGIYINSSTLNKSNIKFSSELLKLSKKN